jgi:hypothetical protein
MKNELIETKTEFLSDYKTFVESVNEFKSDVNKITMEKIGVVESIWDTDLHISTIESMIDDLLLSKCSSSIKSNILAIFNDIMANVNNGLYYRLLKDYGEYDDYVNHIAKEKIDTQNESKNNI